MPIAAVNSAVQSATQQSGSSAPVVRGVRKPGLSARQNKPLSDHEWLALGGKPQSTNSGALDGNSCDTGGRVVQEEEEVDIQTAVTDSYTARPLSIGCWPTSAGRAAMDDSILGSPRVGCDLGRV